MRTVILIGTTAIADAIKKVEHIVEKISEHIM